MVGAATRIGQKALGAAAHSDGVRRAAEVGGPLAGAATDSLGNRPVLNRVAGDLSQRFLGVDITDLLREVDRSDVDLDRLGEGDQLERLAAVIIGRAKRDVSDSGREPPTRHGGDDRSPGTDIAAKGAKTAAALALSKKLVLPAGLVAAVVVAVLLFRSMAGRRAETAPPQVVEAREPYSVRTERNDQGVVF